MKTLLVAAKDPFVSSSTVVRNSSPIRCSLGSIPHLISIFNLFVQVEKKKVKKEKKCLVIREGSCDPVFSPKAGVSFKAKISIETSKNNIRRGGLKNRILA